MSNRPARSMRGNCVLVLLGVIVIVGGLGLVIWLLGEDPGDGAGPDDALRREVREQAEKALTPEQLEKLETLRNEAARLWDQVRSRIGDTVESAVLDRMGDRVTYAVAVQAFEDAGGIDPATLQKPDSVAQRLDRLDRVVAVEQIAAQVQANDRQRLTLYRETLELFSREQGAWSVDSETGEARFESPAAAERYKRLQADLAKLDEEREQLSAMLRMVRSADDSNGDAASEPSP